MSLDLAAALANVDLGTQDGLPVIGVGVEIRNAAGGLQDALKTDPVIIHKGDRVLVLLDCEMIDLSFKSVKDNDAWRRNHILRANGATIVDGEAFQEALRVQAEKIEKAKREAAGTADMDDALALQAEHDDGQHASGLVDGCPACVEERELAEAGS